MDELLPNYSMWRHKYAKATIILYFLVIILEVAIFVLLKSNNMILQPIPEYIMSYFVCPVSWNTIVGVISYFVSKYSKSENVKNAVSVVALTFIVGIVAIIHNVFFVTLLLFCVPIFMTIVFGDKKLLYLIVSLSTVFVLTVVFYCYTVTDASRSNPYFLPSVLISLVVIWSCGGIGSTLICLLNTQNEKIIIIAEEAVRANKAKTAFLSNMSHEIRTPMNAIVGFTDAMLRSESGLDNKKCLLNIKHCGNAMLSLINNILDFSKLESGKMELNESSYLLEDIFDDLSMIFEQSIADKDVQLKIQVDDEVPKRLYGDEMRIMQILFNLVNNSIKFTEKGFVRLSVKLNKIVDDNVELLFWISDSGQGIKKEDLSNLFFSFEQENNKKNNKKEGSGLGLAITKELVELMGGELKVESDYGVGTTFSFVIKQKIDKTTPDEELSEEEPTFPGVKVLLVDDNELNREVALTLFEPLEMDVDVAENGQIACDMVQNNRYDIVFMDHMMPVMDGAEATRFIRSLEGDYFKNIPIIALTANVVEEARSELLASGMNEITTKPISMDEIIDVLNRWVVGIK